MRSAVRHSSLSAEPARNCAKLWHSGGGIQAGCTSTRRLDYTRGCVHGFLVAAAMDQRALGSLRFVLARLRVQAKEDEEARNMAATLSLRAAVGGRVLSALSTR